MELVTFVVTETFECKIEIAKLDSALFCSKTRDAAIFDGKLVVQLNDGTIEVVNINEK